MSETLDLPARFDLPPLARVETTWVEPWLVTRLAQHGLRHYMNGQPMDDFHTVGGTDQAFWMVAADGVGSQPNSRHGARIACTAVEHYLAVRIALHTPISQDLLRSAFEAAHRTIHATAKKNGHDPITYSTTLVAALVRGNTIIGGTLGDSGVAVATSKPDADGKPQLTLAPFCSAPQPARAGTTFSIVDPNWRSYFASSESHSPHISAVFVATDGANNIYLAEGEGDESRFDPSWPNTIAERLELLKPLAFCNIYAQILNSLPEGDNRDDRTFLMAYRAPDALRPPAPQPR